MVQAYTVDGFAEAFNISRSLLYALWTRKEGPVFYYAGNKRFVSFVEARRWQETREQMAILRHAKQEPHAVNDFTVPGANKTEERAAHPSVKKAKGNRSLIVLAGGGRGKHYGMKTSIALAIGEAAV